MTTILRTAVLCLSAAGLAFPAGSAAERVTTDAGRVEGVKSAGGVRTFLGIPFAAPPVGDLRWKAPQPVKPWKGALQATTFGPRCMQTQVFSDMVFRDKGPSEDCLYLNVWAPEGASPKRPLPVMVWIYGGGLMAGGSSEPRQDGENLAKKGVVVVSMNYRLGVFGFFSHPELTKESDRRGAGNFGLMDQLAALQWVKRNVKAFGGDPGNVTIFGESAGSFSVSALVASPLARGLFHKAIGESGSFLGRSLAASSLEAAEKAGQEFGAGLGAGSLAALRAKPGSEILTAAAKPGVRRFAAIVDGYYFPEHPAEIYKAGRQAPVPLLAGWNANEQGPGALFAGQAQTAENYRAALTKMFGERASKALELYPGATDAEAKKSAGDLAGDQFIAYSTWKWIERQAELPKGPGVWRYRFDQVPPAENGGPGARGAYHSAEIEFVFGALDSKKLPWRDEDRKVSALMMDYWSNFAKKGDPNGPGLPAWPAYNRGSGKSVLHLTDSPKVTQDDDRQRYEFLDSVGR